MRRKLIFLCALFLNQVCGQSALVFIENQNQWDAEIDYVARLGAGNIFLSAGKIGIHLKDKSKTEENHTGGNRFEESGIEFYEPIQNHFFQITLIGSNSFSIPQGVQKSEGYYNYFTGNDPCRWASNVSGYTEIIYPEIYDGIDLRITSLGANLKYDFIVKIGADPNQIKLEYCGLDGIDQKNGDLFLKTIFGDVIEKSPLSYQSNRQKKKFIASEFHLNQNDVSFFFPEGYDKCEELIIDPLLIFSTFSGSTADNWGSTATPGEHGTLYSSGITNYNSGGVFPSTPGAFQTSYGGLYDIAIIKYDSTGSNFLYATFLGGSGDETPQSLVVDTQTEDLLVLGVTGSLNFPVTPNAFDKTFNYGPIVEDNVLFTASAWDLFVTRINKTGNQLIGSTYLGGTDSDGHNYPKYLGGPLVTNYGDEFRGDIITDDNGNVFLSTVTGSSDFPVSSGFGPTYNGGKTDGAIVKLNPDLSSIIWSGFIGGFLYDAAYSIKFDQNENLIVAGGTTSGNFPITTGAYQSVLGGNVDGWIARITADGSAVLHSTFTGTINFDQVYFIDLNAAGEIFCFGQTNGQIPVTPGVYNNPNSGQFIQKFNSDLSTLEFSTVIGSGITIPNISPTAFLVNECDNIFLSGWGGDINRGQQFWNSTTLGMPITNDAFQKTTAGSDFYFAVLSSNASELKYATYLGGSNSKTHVDGGTSRFDKFGIVYHAVCSGCQAFNPANHSTSDFPTTPFAKSRTNNSTNCNNAAFKFDLASLRARFQTNTVNFDTPDFNNVCFPDSIVFQNKSTGGEIFIWTLGDGTVITKDNSDTTSVIHQFSAEGSYTVKLKVIDYNTCKATDSTTRVIRYFKDEINVMDDADICQGDELRLVASGGNFYNWTDDNSFQSNESSPLVNPQESISYYVTVTDADGCSKQDTVLVNVIPGMDLKWDLDFITDCISKPSIQVRNLSEQESDVKYWFDFGDGQISDQQEATHTYEVDNTYTIKLLGQREFCVFEVTDAFPFYTLFVPNVITPGESNGFNDSLIIGFGKDHTPADAGIPVSITIVDRWGKKVFEADDYKNDWSASGLVGGIYYITMKLGDLTTCKNWVHVVK